MTPAALAMATTVPLVLAGERSFWHFPNADEVRMQAISRVDNEASWPFSVESGQLACAWSGGQKIVFFFEAPPSGGDEDGSFEPRGVLLSVNPLELIIGNIATRSLFQPMADVAELIGRVAPILDVGQRLCDQPQGAQVRPGEL